MFNKNSSLVTKTTGVKKQKKLGTWSPRCSSSSSIRLSAATLCPFKFYTCSLPRKTLHVSSPATLRFCCCCCFLRSDDASQPDHHLWRPQWCHTVEFKNSRSSARFLSRCLSFFDFFTFILIFFPEIMLYLPFFLSFKYLEICTGPEFSSPPFAFLSFLRLCRFSFFPFFLCCFSFFLFLDCFPDFLRESKKII